MINKYDPDAFHHHSNPVIRFIEIKRVKAVLKLTDKGHKEGRVLEVGYGAGNILEKVPSMNLFGIDISALVLSKAKEKLRENTFLLQSDAQSFPIKVKHLRELYARRYLNIS